MSVPGEASEPAVAAEAAAESESEREAAAAAAARVWMDRSENPAERWFLRAGSARAEPAATPAARRAEALLRERSVAAAWERALVARPRVARSVAALQDL